MQSNDETLHLLSIDLGSAPSGLRSTLEQGLRDLRPWLVRAGMQGVPLAIVRSPGALDFYSTESGRHAAFRPVLAKVLGLTGGVANAALVQTTQASGSEVLRHLLRQAAGLDATEHGESHAACIVQAEMEAFDAGTLCPTLESLFRLANNTRRRSLSETELEAPTSTRASRQLEALSAERIVEEELMAFKAAAAIDEPARTSVAAPRVPAPSLFPFSSSEPGSFVRLKVAISPLGDVSVSDRKHG
jgi:hypothetical protein